MVIEMMNEWPGDYMTVNEVARTLRVKPGAVYHWIANGLLEASRLPKLRPNARPQYRIARSVVNALMAGEKEGADDDRARD